MLILSWRWWVMPFSLSYLLDWLSGWWLRTGSSFGSPRSTISSKLMNSGIYTAIFAVNALLFILFVQSLRLQNNIEYTNVFPLIFPVQIKLFELDLSFVFDFMSSINGNVKQDQPKAGIIIQCSWQLCKTKNY